MRTRDVCLLFIISISVVSLASAGKCRDQYRNCPGWSTAGYCQRPFYRSFMKLMCAHSCNTCDVIVEEDTSASGSGEQAGRQSTEPANQETETSDEKDQDNEDSGSSSEAANTTNQAGESDIEEQPLTDLAQPLNNQDAASGNKPTVSENGPSIGQPDKHVRDIVMREDYDDDVDPRSQISQPEPQTGVRRPSQVLAQSQTVREIPPEEVLPLEDGESNESATKPETDQDSSGSGETSQEMKDIAGDITSGSKIFEEKVVDPRETSGCSSGYACSSGDGRTRGDEGEGNSLVTRSDIAKPPKGDFTSGSGAVSTGSSTDLGEDETSGKTEKAEQDSRKESEQSNSGDGSMTTNTPPTTVFGATRRHHSTADITYTDPSEIRKSEPIKSQEKKAEDEDDSDTEGIDNNDVVFSGSEETETDTFEESKSSSGQATSVSGQTNQAGSNNVESNIDTPAGIETIADITETGSGTQSTTTSSQETGSDNASNPETEENGPTSGEAPDVSSNEQTNMEQENTKTASTENVTGSDSVKSPEANRSSGAAIQETNKDDNTASSEQTNMALEEISNSPGENVKEQVIGSDSDSRQTNPTSGSAQDISSSIPNEQSNMSQEDGNKTSKDNAQKQATGSEATGSETAGNEATGSVNHSEYKQSSTDSNSASGAVQEINNTPSEKQSNMAHEDSDKATTENAENQVPGSDSAKSPEPEKSRTKAKTASGLEEETSRAVQGQQSNVAQEYSSAANTENGKNQITGSDSSSNLELGKGSDETGTPSSAGQETGSVNPSGQTNVAQEDSSKATSENGNAQEPQKISSPFDESALTGDKTSSGEDTSGAKVKVPQEQKYTASAQSTSEPQGDRAIEDALFEQGKTEKIQEVQEASTSGKKPENRQPDVPQTEEKEGKPVAAAVPEVTNVDDNKQEEKKPEVDVADVEPEVTKTSDKPEVKQTSDKIEVGEPEEKETSEEENKDLSSLKAKHMLSEMEEVMRSSELKKSKSKVEKAAARGLVPSAQEEEDHVEPEVAKHRGTKVSLILNQDYDKEYSEEDSMAFSLLAQSLKRAVEEVVGEDAEVSHIKFSEAKHPKNVPTFPKTVATFRLLGDKETLRKAMKGGYVENIAVLSNSFKTI